MYEAHNIHRYQQTNLASMSPEKMIVLLYEKLRDYINGAKDDLDKGNWQDVFHKVNSAQTIISELRNALEHSLNSEVTLNLEALYDYLFQENLAFLIDRQSSHLDHTLRVIEPLLTAWRGIPPEAVQQALRDRNPENVPQQSDDGLEPANDDSEHSDPEPAAPGSEPSRDLPPQQGWDDHARKSQVSLSA